MDGVKVARVSVEKLLGRPLNSYERRFAPPKLFVAGKIPIPVYIAPFMLERNLEWPKKMIECGAKVLKNTSENDTGI